MQKSDINQTARSTHRKVKHSTTLNRKYVKRPSKSQSSDMVIPVRRSSKISKFTSAVNKSTASEEQAPVVVERHPMQGVANAKMQMRAKSTVPMPTNKLTAKELKDQAIKKALADAAKSTKDDQNGKMTKTIQAEKPVKVHFGFGRVMLALSCAAVAVFAIVYFVNLNMPDISLRVAAMQTGIEASYPSYVPRDFSLTDITSENGKITLNFKNHTTDDSFSLIEEQSSWDSNALLTNYVKDNYSSDYATVREQGLTIYINGGNASWVNGGVVYKIITNSGSLTKKQICSIAVSL